MALKVKTGKKKFTIITTNECYEVFKLEYDRLTELFIPKLNKKIGRPRAPWLTNNVLKLVALKKNLWLRNQG